MKLSSAINRFCFSTITHIRGRPELRADNDVDLRGIHIKSTSKDSPTLIFIPEIFDQAESWLQFFSNPSNRIIQNRNVYILYPRNFGNSDRNPEMGWESHAHDITRFMYNHQISMATFAGHGLGGKIALAAACYNYKYTTGFFGIDTTPTNQFYFEPFHELRGYLNELKQINLRRPIGAILVDLKRIVKCPKWRSIFEINLQRSGNGYEWKFDFENVWANLQRNNPSSIVAWPKNIGLYPGRSCFVFPEHSRYVYLNTNTLPMMTVCPQSRGFNDGIYAIQGDQNPLNHWIYELRDEVNPYAYRMSHWLRHYDGVHVLLQNREEVGSAYIPDNQNARDPRPEFASQIKPAHYHHNWRFNNTYEKH